MKVVIVSLKGVPSWDDVASAAYHHQFGGQAYVNSTIFRMADERSASKDLAEGARSILERVGEFFHIFDLTFFVAGTVSLGAAVFLASRTGHFVPHPIEGWFEGIALLVACYTCGLMAFAIGRLINGAMLRRRTLHSTLLPAIRRHGLMSPSVEQYVESGEESGEWRLYIRIWQDIVHERPRSVALSHLSRYWAMAAIYDGLGTAFLAWFGAVALSTCPRIVEHSLGWPRASLLAVVFASLAYAAFRQGAKFFEYQIEDLVAAAAASKATVL